MCSETEVCASSIHNHNMDFTDLFIIFVTTNLFTT